MEKAENHWDRTVPGDCGVSTMENLEGQIRQALLGHVGKAQSF